MRQRKRRRMTSTNSCERLWMRCWGMTCLLLWVTGIQRWLSNKLERRGLWGKFGTMAQRNDNREQFLAFFVLNNLAIASTMFPHKGINRYTWTSPNGQYLNQIDQVAISSKFKRSVQDVRAYRGADVANDHNLHNLKLSRTDRGTTVIRRYETSKLKMPEIKKQFQLELKNRFSCLSVEVEEEENRSERALASENKVDRKWEKVRDTFCEIARYVLGNEEKQELDQWRELKRELKRNWREEAVKRDSSGCKVGKNQS